MGNRSRLHALSICLLVGYVMLGNAANSKTSSVTGRSSLGIMENVPPTSCWAETDCGPGAICHMSIRVTGVPAMKLLKVLKERVQPDKTFKGWGLEIYVSKDGFLNCDETDKNKPFCTIFFNPSEAKIEQALSCE
jgi:hypothetical protein